MNFRLTAILILALLALIGGLLVFVLVDDKPATDAVLLGSLAGLKADDIEVVEITRTEPAEETLVFARAGKDRWELRQGNAGRLDLAAVNRAIETLLRLKPTTSPDLTSDPAKHGLDKPTLKATLRSKHGSDTLLIGETTIGGDKAVTFVASADRPTVPIAVKRADIAGLFRDDSKEGSGSNLARGISEYRLKRLLGVDLFDMVGQARQIKVSASGKELILQRTSGSEWKFESPAGYGLVDIAGDPAPKTDAITGMRPLVTLFSTLSALEPSDFIEHPEPLVKYGLDVDNKDLIRIEVVPNEGPAEVLLIGKKIVGTAPLKYYAIVPGEPVVVKVLGERLDALVKTVVDPRMLQDRTLVKELDLPRIAAVDIAAAGTKVNLRKVIVGSQSQWQIFGGSEPHPSAGPAITALLQALTQPRVALEALTAPVDAMFGPSEIKAEVQLWIDGVEKVDTTETKMKSPATMTILFGKVVGDKAYCRRVLADGSKIDFLVPASLTAIASKKRGEYFELKFKEFPTNLVRKLSFNRGVEQFELVRSERGDDDFVKGRWTFLKPDKLKGQTADTEVIDLLITNLATLSASSVASEDPNETELAIMGLTPPRLKAVASPAEGEPLRTDLFGNETPDKLFVYYKNPAKPMTYLLPRVTIDAFLNAELRDRTPYRFEVKDVKSVRLKGWKTKPIHEVVLERDGENWKVQGTPTVAANPVAVLNLLHHFRAPRPVTVIGGQTPEQGFDAAKGGDPLEVTFMGVKGPIVVVTLGNTVGNTGDYYAWNSKTGEVLTLNGGLFKQFKDGPEQFRK